MLVGPMMLFMLTMAIVRNGSGWLTLVDFAFFAVLSAMLGARCLDFYGGDARTSTGGPATATNLRRYLVGTLLVGLGVYVLANVLANHVLSN